MHGVRGYLKRHEVCEFFPCLEVFVSFIIIYCKLLSHMKMSSYERASRL